MSAISLASKWITGLLGLAKGGSGANLSSTGPGLLRQASSGAVITSQKEVFLLQFHSRGNATSWTISTTTSFFGGAAVLIYKVDLARYNQVKMSIVRDTTTGPTGGKARLVYSTSFSNSTGSYSSIANSGQVELDIVTANVGTDTGWVTMASGAQVDDVFITIVGDCTSGSASPGFGAIILEFRRN